MHARRILHTGTIRTALREWKGTVFEEVPGGGCEVLLLHGLGVDWDLATLRAGNDWLVALQKHMSDQGGGLLLPMMRIVTGLITLTTSDC